MLHTTVSKKKRRYQMFGFDLDLSYITPRIVAMGFPSESVEAAYRNPMKEVYRFFETFHHEHYWVYNLCSERGYDASKFHDRVSVFPFDDHNAPPFEIIDKCCSHVMKWLAADPANVAVIHCKAGKGRTGLIISSLLVHCREWNTPDEALTYYAAARTLNKQGVTIPIILLKRIILRPKPKLPENTEIAFRVYNWKTAIYTYHMDDEKRKGDKHGTGPTAAAPSPSKKPSKKDKTSCATETVDDDDEPQVSQEVELSRMQLFTNASQHLIQQKEKGQPMPDLFEFLLSFKKRVADVETQQGWPEEVAEFNVPNLPCFGDIKIEVMAKSTFGTEHMFNLWFNTAFVEGGHAVFHKAGLDKGFKDKRLAPSFEIEIFADSIQARPPEIEQIVGASEVNTPEVSRYKCAQAIHSRFFTAEMLKKSLDIIVDPKPQISGVVNSGPPCPGPARTPEQVVCSCLEHLIYIYLRCGYWGHLVDENVVGVAYHPDFPKFLLSLRDLQTVDLAKLTTPDMKTAFWLNVYNLMALHSAAVTNMMPSREPLTIKAREKQILMQSFQYYIGGYIFSHYEIEHAVLRAGMPVPDNGMGPGAHIPDDDPRATQALTTHDPRISFALCLGTTSSPVVWVYHSASVQAELDNAVKFYLKSSALCLPPIKQVWLPENIQWYLKDFGTKNSLYEFLERHVPENFAIAHSTKTKHSTKKKKSVFLRYTVRWNEFDWELRVSLGHLASPTCSVDHGNTTDGPRFAAHVIVPATATATASSTTTASASSTTTASSTTPSTTAAASSPSVASPKLSSTPSTGTETPTHTPTLPTAETTEGGETHHHGHHHEHHHHTSHSPIGIGRTNGTKHNVQLGAERNTHSPSPPEKEPVTVSITTTTSTSGTPIPIDSHTLVAVDNNEEPESSSDEEAF
ncbi:phosphatidylinositol-3,4,5-trisphosphate 3-phosphatase [Pelomyxa schiedti]|nr:phosphatidylinositol-3,4,5-trisphosphate 3-phosphatase [Pelomyxa schiedti]